MTKYIKALVILVCIIILSGCNSNSTIVTENITKHSTWNNINLEETSETEKYTEEITYTVKVQKNENLHACRSRLTNTEQNAYDKFLLKILNYEEYLVDLQYEPIDYDSFYRVTDALRGDYPEFWLYLSTDESLYEEYYQDKPRFIKIGYDYNWLIVGEFESEYMDEYMSQINSVCDEIISKMPNGTNTDKYEFLGREI